MAVTKGSLGEDVVAINDITYVWATEFGDQGLQELNEDIVIEETTQSEEMSENRADGSRWRSMRSWHGGEGQTRFDSPSSNPAAFKESKGVDVFTTPGEMKLLKEVTKIYSATNSYPSGTQKIVATDASVFTVFLSTRSVSDAGITSGAATLTSATAAFTSADVGLSVTIAGAGAAGATLTTYISAFTNSTTVTVANNASTTVSNAAAVIGASTSLKRFSALDGSDATVVGVLSEAAKDIADVATDGSQVYVALSSDGTHRSVTPTSGTEEAFDSGSYTDTSVTSSQDTTIKQEGTGSRKVSTTVTTTGTAAKNFAATENYSAVYQFKFWVRCERNTTAGEVNLRLQTSASNYYTYAIPALVANSWTEITVAPSQFTSVGSPSWSTIDTIVLVPAPVLVPSIDTIYTAVTVNNAATVSF